MSYQTKYKTAQLSKLKVFYREVGNPEYPTVLLLHGCPSSPHTFRNLIPALPPYAHLVALDLPGFGNTESLIDGSFHYTFDNMAIVVGELAEHLGLESLLHLTGFRLAIAHTERVIGLIVQNGNAYEKGLTPAWAEIRNYWDDHSPEAEKALLPLLTLGFTKHNTYQGLKKSPSSSPDAWQHNFYFFQQSGREKIQLDQHYDSRNNLRFYPILHAQFRQRPTLIVWGKSDFIFCVEGAPLPT